MSRTALVHPRTAKLGPDEQAQGVYVYTPPEVVAYRNGESLDADSMQTVRAFYAELGQPLPIYPALAAGLYLNTEEGTALQVLAEKESAPFYSNKGGGTDTTPVTRSVGMAPELAAPYGKKVVRKSETAPAPSAHDVMKRIVGTALSTYNKEQKEDLFNELAAELGYTVE